MFIDGLDVPTVCKARVWSCHDVGGSSGRELVLWCLVVDHALRALLARGSV